MIGIIYKITNLVNGKIYIGQTTRTLKQRMAEHKSSTDTAIGHAINKYGLENFKSETVEECETLDELNEREIFWIAHYNCIAPNGYNLKEGGKNGTHSAETRAKLSEINKGKKLSPETCKKISDSKKGTRLSLEVRAKFSAMRKGKTMSEAARANMKKAQEKNRKAVVCVETGEIFSSTREAARSCDGEHKNIVRACKKSTRTAYGFHWKFFND